VIQEATSASFGFLAYFFWNLSTLPAESTSFCLPVKKGWQREQISTFRSPIVDRVSKELPQMQVMIVRLYVGWMPFFIENLQKIGYWDK